MNYNSLLTAGWLLWRDIRVIKKDFLNNLLDAILLPISVVYISGYVLPLLGLPEDYGTFTLIGLVVGMCFNATGTDSSNLVTDLEGPKAITYELSLPLPYWLVALKIGVSYAIKSAVANIWIFPVGYLILGNQFDMSHFSLFKTTIMYMLMNLFVGYFALLTALLVKNMDDYGRFWIRWGWQLYVIAGAQFSWINLYQASKILALINLLNPLVYSFEGMRAAIMGQPGYIDFWICVGLTIFFTILTALWTLYAFKKRLDCL